MFHAFDFTAAIGEPPSVGAEVLDRNARVSRNDLRLLAEIGVLALARERGEAALPIFELLEREQQDNAAGAIGIAMIELSRGRDREAFARLRRAMVEKRRCVTEAKAVLCVLLMGFGRAGEANALRREILRGPDCGARRLVAAYC